MSRLEIYYGTASISIGVPTRAAAQARADSLHDLLSLLGWHKAELGQIPHGYMQVYRRSESARKTVRIVVEGDG